MTFSHIFASIHRSLRTVGLSFFGLILLSAWLVPVQSVTAITDLNLHAILHNTQHFNGACADQATDGAQSPRVSDEEVKKAYLIGDSKGFHLQTKGTIEDKFRNNNWQLTRNAVPGRSYSSGGGNFPGAPPAQTIADALSADATTIQQADAIIIELGTNPPTVESNFTTKLRNLVGDLKDLNPDANYYYVDIGATANPNEYSRRNRIIHDEAASLGYKVISEYKNNFGNSADPKNIPGPDSINLRTDTSPPADTNDYLEGDFIHNTDAGAVSLAELIATEVTGSSGSTPADTAANAAANGCVCQVSGSGTGTGNFSGSTTGEMAFNFFVSKGLSPAQAAGIVGNLMVESGGHTINLDTRATNGSHWGIAQWDSGRWGDLAAFAASPKVLEEFGSNDIYDIKVQLAFIWFEMTGEPATGTPGGGSESRTIGPLRAAQTATEAADVFNRLYERSGTSVGRRAEHAEAVLLLFGGQAGGGTTTPASGTPGSGCPNTIGAGTFQWPVEGTGSISACWGDVRRGGRRHSGLDIAVPTGTDVLAAADGEVEVATDQGDSGYGKVIVIKHDNGFWTQYGHNSELLVAEGDRVTKGQVIAKSGNTGYSFGAHLHFNVQRVGGIQGSANNTVNPLTNGLSIPNGVSDPNNCQDYPDGGRQGGNI